MNPLFRRIVRAVVVLAAVASFVPRLASAQDVDVPPPRGMLSDFANIVPADRAARIERVAQMVRDKSKGEIAIVTMSDIGTRDVGDVALRIGRQWGVGGKGEAGDPTKNAGVVILLVPRQTSSDGKGHISIQVGRGAEGFLTDADAGDIRREATPALKAGDYGAGLELITIRVAERFAREYQFSVDSVAAGGEGTVTMPQNEAPRARRRGGFPWGILIFVLIFILLSRRRGGGCLPIFIPTGGGGWSSGGGGGFGGGDSGGGFGGFGGGGGFSGGGSSGDF